MFERSPRIGRETMRGGTEALPDFVSWLEKGGKHFPDGFPNVGGDPAARCCVPISRNDLHAPRAMAGFPCSMSRAAAK